MMTYDPSQTYGLGGMTAQHPLLAGALQGGGIQHPLLALSALQSQFGGGIQHPLLAAAMQNQLASQTPLGGQGAWGGGRSW